MFRALPLWARSPREREVDCALCVKRMLISAISEGVCRDMDFLRYMDKDVGVDKCEDKVKEQSGYSMARGSGFSRVASPSS